MSRRLYVPIDYHHYSPHPVIVGVRRCPPFVLRGESDVLHALADAEPGWQTLALCDQRPIRWGLGNTLRVVACLAGNVAEGLPRDAWHPVGS
jgi:hypothetical protein